MTCIAGCSTKSAPFNALDSIESIFLLARSFDVLEDRMLDDLVTRVAASFFVEKDNVDCAEERVDDAGPPPDLRLGGIARGLI